MARDVQGLCIFGGSPTQPFGRGRRDARRERKRGSMDQQAAALTRMGLPYNCGGTIDTTRAEVGGIEVGARKGGREGKRR